MRRKGIAILAAVAVGGALLAAGPAALDFKATAAKVNGDAISVADLARECVAQYGDRVLAQMIQLRIVEEAAKKRNITVTDKEIAKRAWQIRAQVQARGRVTGMDFNTWLLMQGLTLRGFVYRVKLELLLAKMVEGQVKVTDEELARYYESHREQFRQPELMRVSHICVKDKQLAEKIRQDILAGKISFADAARQYSIDPYTKDRGGDLGWIERGNDPLQKAAFALKKDGEISPVVQTKMGYHIVRREAYQSARIPPFEEIQDKLRQLLREQKIARLSRELLQQLIKQANVERLLDFQSLNADVLAILQSYTPGQGG